MAFDEPLGFGAKAPVSDWNKRIGVDYPVRTLEARGVTFVTPITDQGFGLVTTFELPGAVPVLLYQPRHAQP